MNQAERETRKRKRILEHARTTRNVAKTCRYFGVSRWTFYLWRRRYQAQADAALIKKKPIPWHRLLIEVCPGTGRQWLHRTFLHDPERAVALDPSLSLYSGTASSSPGLSRSL